MHETHYALAPIGFLRSPLKERGAAPRQGREGAPDAWLDVDAAVAEGLDGIEVGAELIVITWLHQAERDTLKTHPRNDQTSDRRLRDAVSRSTQSPGLAPRDGSGNRRREPQSGANRSD